MRDSFRPIEISAVPSWSILQSLQDRHGSKELVLGHTGIDINVWTSWWGPGFQSEKILKWFSIFMYIYIYIFVVANILQDSLQFSASSRWINDKILHGRKRRRALEESNRFGSGFEENWLMGQKYGWTWILGYTKHGFLIFPADVVQQTKFAVLVARRPGQGFDFLWMLVDFCRNITCVGVLVVWQELVSSWPCKHCKPKRARQQRICQPLSSFLSSRG